MEKNKQICDLFTFPTTEQLNGFNIFMLVKRIRKFINDLETMRELAIDAELYTVFFDYFKNDNDNHSLYALELAFLVGQFALRFRAVTFTANDYTLQVSGVNKLWIDLAKELAPELNKSYVTILFPDISNTVDPIDFSPLSETQNTDNFFLGSCGKVLYRKFSFCNYLVDRLKKEEISSLNGSEILSVLRPADSSEPATLSVDELMRLKACIPTREIQVDGKKYNSFWSFLNARVFVLLNYKNSLSLPLMAYFLPLLGRYFEFKTEGRSFTDFKNEFTAFLHYLYKQDPEIINQFYGLYYLHEGKRVYFLDSLIEFMEATNYSLDSTVVRLLNALQNINSTLYLKKPSLRAFYTKPKSSPNNSDLEQCRLFFLSIFTKYFPRGFLDTGTSAVCDVYTPVSDEIAKMYNRFSAVTEKSDKGSRSEKEQEESLARDEVALERIYHKLVKDKVAEAEANKNSFWGFLACMGTSSSFLEWRKLAVDGTLGLQWYDPKLIVYALVNFKSSDASINFALDKFFEEFICSYCQNPKFSLFQSQIRINVLFSRFLAAVESKTEKEAILQLLSLCVNEDYQERFMDNCKYYIYQRLQQINGGRTEGVGLNFFSGTRKLEQIHKVVNGLTFASLHELVQYWSNAVESNRLAIEPAGKGGLISAMVAFLFNCKSPIITYEKELEIRQSVNAQLEYSIRR